MFMHVLLRITHISVIHGAPWWQGRRVSAVPSLRHYSISAAFPEVLLVCMCTPLCITMVASLEQCKQHVQCFSFCQEVFHCEIHSPMHLPVVHLSEDLPVDQRVFSSKLGVIVRTPVINYAIIRGYSHLQYLMSQWCTPVIQPYLETYHPRCPLAVLCTARTVQW